VECARRVRFLIQALSRCEDSLSRWYQPVRTRKKALERPLPSDTSLLAEMLRRNVNRADSDKSIIEELGFSLSTDNGEPDGDSAHLQITCGGYAQMVSNFCTLTLPHRGPHAQQVLTTPVLMDVVRGMARAWEPDWAVAMSHQQRELDRSSHIPRSPYTGWITYLSRRRGTVPPLPTPVLIEHVDSLGTLIALTPERFTASNPEHLALARRVRELLNRAGLLGPIIS
jgi:hypothetical protein